MLPAQVRNEPIMKTGAHVDDPCFIRKLLFDISSLACELGMNTNVSIGYMLPLAFISMHSAAILSSSLRKSQTESNCRTEPEVKGQFPPK